MKRSVFLAVTVPVVLSILLFSPGISRAGCVKRALTAGEQAFYEQVRTAMDQGLPAPEGWRRRDSWMNVPKTVCEGFEKNPIRYTGLLKITEITELDRAREEMGLKQKELEDRIMEASSRGDFAEMSRLQSEMQKFISESLEKQQEMWESSRNAPKPLQMIAKFSVNNKRKAIGKQYDIPALPHTTKTFEVIYLKGTERETISKILLIGRWKVEDFIKNWNLFRPEVPYDAIGGIHLRLSGKRQQVEAYLSKDADIGLIESATR